jgi:hypothetical protein
LIYRSLTLSSSFIRRLASWWASASPLKEASSSSHWSRRLALRVSSG